MKDFDNAFRNRHILITGGLGFIGSTLAYRLVSFGAHVVLIDSLIPTCGGNLFNVAGIEDRADINISDIGDEQSLAVLVQNQDYLFNLAGQTSHLDSMQDPYTDLEINCRAQLSVLEACRKYNPAVNVVFASTRQVYGKPDYLPVDEKHPLHPVDTNGIHKLAGEWYHLLYHKVYGIPTSILRLTNTYGPRMRIKDARQTFLGVWIKAVIQGTAFEVWEGQQLRDFTYVDDAVDALLLAAISPEATGRIFNLGGTQPISLKELADLLVLVNGGGKFEIRDFPVERKKIDIDDYYADFTEIQHVLDWTPQVPLEVGLARTLTYFRDHIEHYV